MENCIMIITSVAIVVVYISSIIMTFIENLDIAFRFYELIMRILMTLVFILAIFLLFNVEIVN